MIVFAITIIILIIITGYLFQEYANNRTLDNRWKPTKKASET
jgi:hypothetical protein